VRKRWSVLGVPLAVAALLAGCSSSSSDSSSGGGGGAGTGSANEIPIGVIGGYSGPVASNLAVTKLAIQAWADEVNAGGGLHGRKVHLYIEDDKGSSQTGVTAVKRLVEQNHVVAIVGQEASSSDNAWAQYIEDKGVPVVGGVAHNLVYLKYPHFFSTGGNLASLLYGDAQLARANGPQIGTLYCAELSECAANPTLFAGLGKPLGLSVGYKSKVAASSPDYTAVCQGVKSSGVQSYFLGLGSAVLTKLVPQCVQQGVKARVVLPDVLDSTFAAQSAFDGVEVSATGYPFFDESIPAAKEMHDALAKYAPSVASGSMPLNGNATETYIAGKLFEAAVKASGSSAITSESVIKGLYALKGQTLGGLAPPLTFTPGKPSLHNCYFSYTIKAGKFALRNSGKPTCVDSAVLEPVLATIEASH
jgi:branched-chain amino acid transport system substrate-binding protein